MFFRICVRNFNKFSVFSALFVQSKMAKAPFQPQMWTIGAKWLSHRNVSLQSVCGYRGALSGGNNFIREPPPFSYLWSINTFHPFWITFELFTKNRFDAAVATPSGEQFCSFDRPGLPTGGLKISFAYFLPFPSYSQTSIRPIQRRP